MRRGTAASRSSPTCRAGSSADSNRGNIFRMRRLACLALLATVAACARPPAPVVTPVVVSAPKFPEFIVPVVPADLAGQRRGRQSRSRLAFPSGRRFEERGTGVQHRLEDGAGVLSRRGRPGLAGDRAQGCEGGAPALRPGARAAASGSVVADRTRSGAARAESGIRRADGVRGRVGRRSVAAGAGGRTSRCCGFAASRTI